MNEILFEALIIFIMVIGSIITKYVVSYIQTLENDSCYAELLDTVEKAVKRAEQKIKERGQGVAKKAWVTQYMTRWLNEMGFDITEEQLDTLIEAAVFSMNNKE